MKNKILILATSLSVLFVYYTIRLSEAIESSANSSSPSVVPSKSDAVATELTEVAVLSGMAGEWPRATYNRFVVNNSSRIDVTGRKGTLLSFPPNSFEDGNGNVVVDGIELVFEECYDLSEMLAEKLSTTSGASLIETAGMVNIQARKNGVELKLRDGIQYNVSFPKQGEGEEGFELFYGKRNDNGIMDWIKTGQIAKSNTRNEAKDSNRSLQDVCFIQICESEFRRRTIISKTDYFNWTLTGGQTLNQWFISNFNPDAEMSDDFCSKKLISQITFHVNSDGSFKDYYISHESVYGYDRVIADFLSTMPPLDLTTIMPSYTSDHACVLSFGHKQGSSSDEFVTRFASKYDYADGDSVMSEVSSADLDYYMFSSTELGWINCDRFYDEESPLVDFYVEASTADGSSVSMVFEDRKSIVRGYKNGDQFVFAGIPAGKEVRLVAMENATGSPTLEVKCTNTSQLRCKLNHYEPMTLSKLDGAICWK